MNEEGDDRAGALSSQICRVADNDMHTYDKILYSPYVKSGAMGPVASRRDGLSLLARNL